MPFSWTLALADSGVYSSHSSHMEKWLTGTRIYLFSGSLSPDRLSLLDNLQRATSHLALRLRREPTTTRLHFLEAETKVKQAIGRRGAPRKNAQCAVQFTGKRTTGYAQKSFPAT